MSMDGGPGGAIARRATALALAAAASVAAVTTAAAQRQPGDASSGLRFAELWCSGCHPISLTVARAGGIAPDFGTIASRPTTTASTLQTFLEEEHSVMPNFRLTPDETDDIIAYILTLKR
jgi:mono/diheme cytochrome c family protein